MPTYQYKREPLTSQNADRLANACRSGIEKVVIATLLDTGLRVSELAGLTKENVLWQDRRLLVHGKGGPFGKKTKRRIVPLTERAFTLLSNYFSLNDSFGYTARGIQKIVRRVTNRAGISQKVSPHVLRHTFAAACVKKGLSTRYLQMFLGHDHLATTEIYLNVSPEDACAEFKKRF
jgi:integrase/recombinase XerD